MTPCDYLKAIDYLLYDLEDQLDTNYFSAKSPNNYGYQLFLWNLREVNAVLEIADTFGLFDWVRKHHKQLFQDIEKTASYQLSPLLSLFPLKTCSANATTFSMLLLNNGLATSGNATISMKGTPKPTWHSS